MARRKPLALAFPGGGSPLPCWHRAAVIHSFQAEPSGVCVCVCHISPSTPLFSWQDLLQLQYEGVAVMKLFDRAKVNVNLLIFLLNKKFYGK